MFSWPFELFVVLDTKRQLSFSSYFFVPRGKIKLFQLGVVSITANFLKKNSPLHV